MRKYIHKNIRKREAAGIVAVGGDSDIVALNAACYRQLSSGKRVHASGMTVLLPVCTSWAGNNERNGYGKL